MSESLPGEREMPESKNEKKIQKLIKDLEKILDRNQVLILLIVILHILLFGACLWLVLSEKGQTVTASGVGILGASAAGSVTWLHSLWRQKIAIELLIGVAGYQPAALDTLVSILSGILQNKPGKLPPAASGSP